MLTVDWFLIAMHVVNSTPPEPMLSLDIYHFATYLFHDKKCEIIMNLTFDPTTEW